MRGIALCLSLLVGSPTDIGGATAVTDSAEVVYIVGTIGTHPETSELPAGIEAQTRQAMENVRVVLQEQELRFSDVVSVNVFLSDVRLFQEMNAVYRGYFPTDPPARATVKADIAVPGALVQIAMVVARKGVGRTTVTPDGMQRPDLP